MQYTIRTEVLEFEGDISIKASIPELRLSAYGLSENEAIRHLNELARVELEHRRAQGRCIPSPNVLAGALNLGELALDLPVHQPAKASFASVPSSNILYTDFVGFNIAFVR